MSRFTNPHFDYSSLFGFDVAAAEAVLVNAMQVHSDRRTFTMTQARAALAASGISTPLLTDAAVNYVLTRIAGVKPVD